MTPEIEAALRKAEQSLSAAQKLLEDEYYDFSASRAYYAMFYLAEAYLLSLGLSFSKHSAVIAAFGKNVVKEGIVPQSFHQYLIKAQDDRLIGDYDFITSLDEEDVLIQITRAKEFLAFSKNYFKIT